MLIEDYFIQIQQTINSNQLIQSHNIIYQKRDIYLGYIKGEINFINGSCLYLTEYIEVEHEIDRGKYSY